MFCHCVSFQPNEEGGTHFHSLSPALASLFIHWILNRCFAVSWTVTRPGSSLTPHLEPQRPAWPSVTTSQVLWPRKVSIALAPRPRDQLTTVCGGQAVHWLSCIILPWVTSSQHLSRLQHWLSINLISCPALLSRRYQTQIELPSKKMSVGPSAQHPRSQRMATKLNHQIPNIEANKIDLHSPC